MRLLFAVVVACGISSVGQAQRTNFTCDVDCNDICLLPRNGVPFIDWQQERIKSEDEKRSREEMWEKGSSKKYRPERPKPVR
jgi:hypothetical protein